MPKQLVKIKRSEKNSPETKKPKKNTALGHHGLCRHAMDKYTTSKKNSKHIIIKRLKYRSPVKS